MKSETPINSDLAIRVLILAVLCYIASRSRSSDRISVPIVSNLGPSLSLAIWRDSHTCSSVGVAPAVSVTVLDGT